MSTDEETEFPEEKDSYMCAVCLDVYFNPYMCYPCHHIFCEPCLRTLAKDNPASTPCPLCRTIISRVFLQTGNILFHYHSQVMFSDYLLALTPKASLWSQWKSPTMWLHLSQLIVLSQNHRWKQDFPADPCLCTLILLSILPCCCYITKDTSMVTGSLLLSAFCCLFLCSSCLRIVTQTTKSLNQECLMFGTVTWCS